MRVLCLGGSYTGKAMARRLVGECEVVFLSRESFALRNAGFKVVTPEGLQEFANRSSINLVLDSVPPVYNANGRLAHAYADATKMVQRKWPEVPVVHLSTTSVYPAEYSAEREEDLPVLDEDSPTKKESERLALEGYVSSLWSGVRIVRSGGIYGPGRCMAARFREGDFRRTESGNLMVSRIHVHDLARLVLAVGRLEGTAGPTIVNAVDERSSSNRETFTYLGQRLGMDIPGDWRTAKPQGRQVVSKYAKTLLKGRFAYPSYKEGFDECLTEEE